MKRVLSLLGLCAASGAAFLALWACLPEAAADPAAAAAAIRAAARQHQLMVAGVEVAPWQRAPIWVEWHPRRLLRAQQTRSQRLLLDREQAAQRYILRDPETAAEINCELQQRSGQIVWIWLDGPESEARRIKAVRGELREAMPWLPVSCPWQ